MIITRSYRLTRSYHTITVLTCHRIDPSIIFNRQIPSGSCMLYNDSRFRCETGTLRFISKLRLPMQQLEPAVQVGTLRQSRDKMTAEIIVSSVLALDVKRRANARFANLDVDVVAVIDALFVLIPFASAKYEGVTDAG